MTVDTASFTFSERDEFQRKGIAEKVITLLKSETVVSPMVIDGSWGTGKTEFCHKLINLFNEQDSHSLIYIDAFKADHADEPLLTVLAEVLKLIPNDDKRESLIKKIIPGLRFGIKTGLKAGFAHLLRQDAADVANDFDKEIKKVADKAIDASVEVMLKDHLKADKSLKALQSALHEIASEKPIVIFIDELDRCRPDFAVNMLEVIKHTFDVEAVQFVLITNTQQLKASINHCYGSTIDAQRYLDKFLKFSFCLPSQVNSGSNKPVQASLEHYRLLIAQSPNLVSSELQKRQVLDFIEHCIRLHNISLREIESIIRYMNIYQDLTNNDAFISNQILGYTLLRVFAVILLCLRPEIASAISSGNSDAKVLGEFLGESKTPPYPSGISRPKAHQFILVIIGVDCFRNSELFVPVEGDSEAWNDIIERGLFVYDVPEKSERLGLVEKTINVLTFSK